MAVTVGAEIWGDQDHCRFQGPGEVSTHGDSCLLFGHISQSVSPCAPFLRRWGIFSMWAHKDEWICKQMRFQCHQRDYSSFSSSESYCFQCWYRHSHCIFHHWLLLPWRCLGGDGALASTPQQQFSPTEGSLQQWRMASPSVACPRAVWRCSLRRGTFASCCPNQMEEEEAAHCALPTQWVWIMETWKRQGKTRQTALWWHVASDRKMM